MSHKPGIAIVTGGTRGIGLAVVQALAERDWSVAFCGRSPESVDRAASRFAKHHGDRVWGSVVDVRDQAQVDTFVSQVEERGGCSCLVNNAGLGRFAPVDQMTGDDWRLILQTNLDGSFYFLRAVAGPMKERGEGWILNIASLASRNPFATGAAYNASKFGLLGLSEAAMLDLRPHGVRVTTILPGSVDTDFGDRGDKDTSWMLAPEDVARTVTDLLSYPERALPSRVELRPTKTSST